MSVVEVGFGPGSRSGLPLGAEDEGIFDFSYGCRGWIRLSRRDRDTGQDRCQDLRGEGGRARLGAMLGKGRYIHRNVVPSFRVCIHSRGLYRPAGAPVLMKVRKEWWPARCGCGQ